MDCGLTFAKYSVFIFNFLFVAAGIAMITVGALAHAKVVEYEEFFKSEFTAIPISLMVVGGIILLIAFLGCCGAIQENTCMLFLFSMILMGIVAAQIALVVYGFIKKGTVEEFLHKQLEDSLRNSRTSNESYGAWDILQKDLKCCGVQGPDDWKSVLDGYLHPACCMKDIKDKTCTISVYSKGCEETFKNFVSNNMWILIGIAIGVGVFELFGIVFACCLYTVYRRGHY